MADDEFRVVEVAPGDPRVPDLLRVLRELRPHLDEDAFATVHARGGEQGLRFSVVLDVDDRCHAVAGWRVVVDTASLRKLYVDDLVTTAAARSRGHGHRLLGHLRDVAAGQGCRFLELDSGTHRTRAHAFYFREGMSISSFHFREALAPPDA